MKECASSKTHSLASEIIIDLIKSKGYSYEDLEYHHIMPDVKQFLLKTAEDSTSYYFRTQPDYFVFNKNESFYLEVKAGKINNNTICIEAYPLLCSIVKHKLLNIRTLYYYLDLQNRIGYRNWASKIAINNNEVIVPKLKKNDILIPIYQKLGLKIKQIDWNKPELSGDPYILSSLNQWFSIKL